LELYSLYSQLILQTVAAGGKYGNKERKRKRKRKEKERERKREREKDEK